MASTVHVGPSSPSPSEEGRRACGYQLGMVSTQACVLRGRWNPIQSLPSSRIKVQIQRQGQLEGCFDPNPNVTRVYTGFQRLTPALEYLPYSAALCSMQAASGQCCWFAKMVAAQRLATTQVFISLPPSHCRHSGLISLHLQEHDMCCQLGIVCPAEKHNV